MKERIYLDYAATTPVLPEVKAAMERVLEEDFGNPAALYSEGRTAKAHRERAREIIARSLGAHPDEIFFTSGGTESNSLAILGIARAMKGKGRHVITTSIEHQSVLGAFQTLEDEGFHVTILPVTSDGLVDPAVFRQSIRSDTVLASVMMANNEIGTIQPIRELSHIALEHRVAFHTDAVQAYPCLSVNADATRVSSLSVSAHKVYGPKGIGALVLRRGTPFSPPMRGGEHERKIRPGTENMPGIVGFAKAAETLERERSADMNRLMILRNRLRDGLLEQLPDSLVNGHPEKRLPNNLNMSFRHAEGETLLIHLDLEGIACSLGSACSAGAIEPSHVLLAIGRSKEEAKSSIRFTLGKFTRDRDIIRVIGILVPFVDQLRSVAAIGGM